MPKPIGRPYPVKGADELYGEMLLQAGRAEGRRRLVRARAGAHAESQSRGARSRAGCRQGGRRAPRAAAPTSSFSRTGGWPIPGCRRSKEAQAALGGALTRASPRWRFRLRSGAGASPQRSAHRAIAFSAGSSARPCAELVVDPHRRLGTHIADNDAACSSSRSRSHSIRSLISGTADRKSA